MQYRFTIYFAFGRKQDFRELKQLQREEMKEATDFYSRIRLDKEAQDKKFELESQVLSSALSHWAQG